MPDKMKRDAQGRIHNSEGSAIHFRDGYELFFWHGTSVPDWWIMNPEKISEKDITGETNAEKRRVLREILGAEKYYAVLGGVKVIHESIDHQGNNMRLLETIKPDEIIKKKVVVLECICPSTGRMYNIYPPDQKSKTVWEAKSSTFGKKANEFKPVIES